MEELQCIGEKKREKSDTPETTLQKELVHLKITQNWKRKFNENHLNQTLGF